ncbi:MAG: arginine--tRNA ligase [Chitinophagaceae bacterium]|jgi:arginyl-tRNA synthetase|nr:arginine--tRNA ligase [Chitinophagaceae bacterium]MBK7679572.1 arginine--tRNA ligase [Chitinophagaceae bacterium]MBK8299080.1 arginine--tRNA ligase [Chitinophagaceae bacterium]MBK9659739.1 arginine--tRNA ligase [Chitinophagaceae bacterium]MBK9937895.1 arginine--tRNA ligase [Chitinophagaceae bacterium]
MSIISQIKPLVIKALKDLYGQDFSESELTINTTKPEFDGDYTLVLFSFVKQLKKSPELLGAEIGEALVKASPDIFTAHNVIKGFLNLTIADNYWINFLQANYNNATFGSKPANGRKVMVEYSSPNTNKPIHLGHLRNNFLGWSVAQILKQSGYETVKSCIVNDRGIHICKSMIAWQLFANGATPQSTNTKGDHFVGEYYVRFNDEYKKQVEELVAGGMKKEDAEKEAPIMKGTQQMLVDWENGKPDVMELWKKMNGWVYEGFDVTYKRIGSDFAKTYYESETYLPGKKFVEEGLKQGVFFRKEDGSVWIDLTEEGLDEKLVLRKDGTSVYITQDLGLAQEKYEDFKYDESIYVIADEQNYHMKVLKLILKKLGKPYADGIYHLSYGMVELPSGRMKSREGTVVDADDMIDEMVNVAKNKTEELGKVKDFTTGELKELYDIIALGALKFFLLRVDPKKRMIFNPEESIDFHGFTGPFVQYTHARIKSILRKEQGARNKVQVGTSLLRLEKDLIILLEQYPAVIEQAVVEHNPSVIAIYAFTLSKSFNTFYTEHSVMNAESEEKKQLRLQLATMTANVIASGMGLLGIRVPERM